MSEENKRNIMYFEDSSMLQLYESMEKWQNENQKRFLSISVLQDSDKFCCIALTNPTEVVITDKSGTNYADVSNAGSLRVI